MEIATTQRPKIHGQLIRR